MPEFLRLLAPPDALQTWLRQVAHRTPAETIPTAAAAGRVAAGIVLAPHAMPAFDRSTVDGYAVRAADTFGASEALPGYLTLAGEAPMGAAPEFRLAPGECALIHTGGMLPAGADAVVMVEYTQVARPGEIEILRAVAPNENILLTGEDVAAGAEVLAPGVRLRPAEIGGLMSLGITALLAAARPRVAILSCGDEVIPPQERPGPGQVRDVNAYTLGALVEAAGGIPEKVGIFPDDETRLRQAAAQALAACDLLVITAGSSASQRDNTAAVISALGEPGVLVHGINLKPGKPTILGVCGGKPVIGLPGNPVSALVVAGLFVRPALAALQGQVVRLQQPTMRARLALNLASAAGREDWVPVRLELLAGSAEWSANPVFGKSNLILTLARADGLLRIPPDATGLAAGTIVEIYSMG